MRAREADEMMNILAAGAVCSVLLGSPLLATSGSRVEPVYDGGVATNEIDVVFGFLKSRYRLTVHRVPGSERPSDSPGRSLADRVSGSSAGSPSPGFEPADAPDKRVVADGEPTLLEGIVARCLADIVSGPPLGKQWPAAFVQPARDLISIIASRVVPAETDRSPAVDG